MKRQQLLILPIVILIISSLCFAQDSLNITFVHEMRVSGYYEDVKVAGDIAYCTNGYGLVVLDVSDPEDPTEISRVPTPGTTRCINIRDTLCFLTDSEAGLMIFNISNPENPELLGVCDAPRSAYWVWIDGDVAYVTNGSHVSETNVISVEDPTDPTAITMFRSSAGTKITVHNGYCYIASGYGVYAWDISDPEHPEEVGFFEYDNSGNDRDLTIHDGYLFVCCVAYVLSIDRPDSMYLVGRYDGNGGGESITFFGDLAYNWDRGVRVYDISDLNNIYRVQYYRIRHDVPNWDNEVGGTGSVYWDGYVIGCLGYVGIDIYDVSRAGEEPMELAGCFGDPSYPRAILINDEFCYVAGKIGRFFVYSLENPREPELVRELNYWEEMDRRQEQYYFYKMKQKDNLLFVTTAWMDLHIYNIENPAEPELLHSIDIYQSFGFEASGGYLYAASLRGGVLVYDISDPTNPEQVEEENPYIITRDVAIAGRCVISTHRRDGIFIWRIREGGQLTELADLEISNNASAKSIVIAGDYAYISCSSPSGIAVVSIEYMNRPVEVNFIEGIDIFSSNRLSIVGSFLYGADLDEGIKIYSIEDPERPVLTGSINTPGFAHDVAVKDGLAYVADRYDVTIYDVSQALEGWWLELPEDVHDFGEVSLDSIAEWELTIHNSSAIDRQITDIIIDNDVFTCSFDTSFILSETSDTTLTISFTPASDTTYTGVLDVVSGDHSLSVSLSGQGILLDATSDEPEVVYNFALYDAYPNPFNSSTSIRYSLDRDGFVTLRLYDLAGREIASLANEKQSAGNYQTVWNAEGIPSGLYILRLASNRSERTAKLLLIR